MDNRGLTPPELMVRVLESVELLGEGEVLVVVNDRRPMRLYPILDERGLICETEELPEGLVRLQIKKGPKTKKSTEGRGTGPRISGRYTDATSKQP